MQLFRSFIITKNLNIPYPSHPGSLDNANFDPISTISTISTISISASPKHLKLQQDGVLRLREDFVQIVGIQGTDGLESWPGWPGWPGWLESAEASRIDCWMIHLESS